MRSPIYRNIDKPFQIAGFSAAELILLCVALAGGGELAQLFSVDRVWTFFVTLIIALGLFLFRRTLGEHFFFRLIRFFQIPSHLYSRLHRFREN
jgi:hypothetical protein